MKGTSSADVHAVFKLAFSQMMLELVLVLVLMVILVMAALYDYRERRVPNALAFSGWLLGPVIHYAMSGVLGLRVSLLGFLIMFTLTFPFWLLGAVGAGDVKLMSTVGALVGSAHVLLVLFTILIAGLVYAVIDVVYTIVRNKVQTAGASAGDGAEHGSNSGGMLLRKKKIPYAIPIAFGTLLGLLLTYK